MYSLKDKVCLVTGGAKGIGAAIVREVVKEGVKHVAILDLDEVAGTAIENEITTKYGNGKALFFKCDVTNDEELFNAFNKTVEGYGVIDLVVNNAGIACESPSVYKKEININYTATVTSTLKALELMRADKGGKGGTIINISSLLALCLHSPSLFVYASTKTAILHFSNCIGMEEYYRHTNVRVLTVCFGVTLTDMAKGIVGIDEITSNEINRFVDVAEEHGQTQSAETAAQGVVTSYKNGKTGSTWLISENKFNDISENVKEGYKTMLK